MKAHPVLRSLCLTLVAWFLSAALGLAQRMPQDDWFFDYEIINQPAKGLHIDKQGNYYLGQTSKVKVLNAQAQPLREIIGFSDVRGMCTNDAGDLFVFDWGTKTIKQYGSQGNFLKSFGGGYFSAALSFENAQGKDLYRQMLDMSVDGQIFAVDPGAFRVNVFDRNGNYLKSFGEYGTAASQFSTIPHGVVCSNDGSCGVLSLVKVVNYPDGVCLRFDKDEVWESSYVNYGEYSGLANVCSTPDNLFVSQDAELGFWGYYHSGYPFIRVFSRGNTVYSYVPGAVDSVYPVGRDRFTFGVACRPNGDIVASTGSELRVWKRRYQGSHVAMDPKALPLPSVLKVAQRAGTAILDVDFKVDDADSPMVEVALVAYKNGESKPSKLILPTSFVDGTQSSMGPSVQANQVHRVSWNLGADWDVETGSVSVEVLAKDNRLLKAQKFAFAPGGAPSASNIQDPDPHSTWLWLLAKRDPAVKFENGNIVGVAAAISGEILATSSTTYEEDWDGDGIIDNVATYEFEAFQSTPAGASYLRGLYAQELGL